MNKIPPEERKLNKEQKQAVEFGEGPLLIIAGAGTGKTTVVTERIKYLIFSGRVKPTEILALTFTEKASREMEERVEVALPYGMPQMWISTFHSFCDKILRAEAINIGLDPGFKLMTEAETIQFFRNHLFQFDLNYFRPLGNPTKFISGMIQHFSRLKDEDVSPEQYIEWITSKISNIKYQISNIHSKNQKDKDLDEDEDSNKYLELAHAYRTYEEMKVREGVADYADLISSTLKLFRMRPKILANYQKQFKYILIDEFQDTNYAQNELAIMLAGKKKNITVVGDDDQAIYRWRGAAVSNIIQFRKRFPKVKIIVLTKNYRSTREILDCSYELIQHNNPDRLEFVEHVDKKLDSVRNIGGANIEILFSDRVENEAERVVKNIQRIHESNQKYNWSDFAILVRANNHAEPFVRALARAAAPYQFLGPGQLFRQAEVKDLIAYLKILYDFEDNVAVWRVVSMDVWGIHPRDIAGLLAYTKRYGITLFESCEHAAGLALEKEETQPSLPKPVVSSDGQKKITSFITMVHRHMGLLKKETAGQILYFFLQDSGLLTQFTSYKTLKEERVAANIAKFFDKLKTYEADHEDASVLAVMDWIDLSIGIGESPLASDTDWTDNNAVNILTVHSAKGLEFPVVFLVNLVSQRFPTTEKREQIPIPDALVKEILPVGDSHLEEERRLCYVGMTRARDYLFFTAAQYYGEGKREKKLSPFIAEAMGSDSVSKLVVQPPDTTKQLTLLEWQKKEGETDELPVRQPITYISHSQLETFNTCPLQYKYRYIIRIPVPASAALTFGDTMHRTIHAFYESVIKGENPTLEALITLYWRLWSPIGFGTKGYEEKMKDHGKELLRHYYEKGFDKAVVPRDLEQVFKIKISPQLSLGGKIDRVDELTGGELEIIDYKTGQSPKSRDAKSDRQLTVYALAATDPGLYGKKPEQVTVSFYFFEDNQKVSAKRTEEQLVQARKEIKETVGQISTSDFHAVPGKYCDFCEFRLICEAWR